MKCELQLRVCGQVISVCNSEELFKIGRYLESYAQMKKGPVFLTFSSFSVYSLTAWRLGWAPAQVSVLSIGEHSPF